jgi:serine/threonine protein kinase
MESDPLISYPTYNDDLKEDIDDFKSHFTDYKYPKILIEGINPDLVKELLKTINDDNKSEVLLKSDVFSLGLTLYIIWRRLTGYALDDEGDLTHLDALNGMSRSETDDAYIPANSQILICKNTNKACIKKTTEIEASKKVFDLVKKMCISDPFKRLSLEEALTEYTSVVLPSIKIAYPHLPQNEGGSRKLRTRRTNKKYVKYKKTRRKSKRK